MTHEFEMLEKRIRRLEFQNRSLKWFGIILTALALASAVWGQSDKNQSIAAQRFELRDPTGKLRAELAILRGEPTLRFLDADGDVESLLDGRMFTIFKKGGDNQAIFGKDYLEFGDGHGKTFFTVQAFEKDQMGKLDLNDYRTRTNALVTAEDLTRVLRPKNP